MDVTVDFHDESVFTYVISFVKEKSHSISLWLLSLLVFQIYDDSIVLHSVFTTARKCLEQTGRLPPQLGGKSESESESDTDDNEERK